MKRIILITIFFLSGCATLTDDTTISEPESSSWSVENTYSGYHLQHECREGGIGSIGIDKVLEREGKVYFIFFAMPIHSAELSDRPYKGIKITSRFPGQRNSCLVSDVSLNTGNESHAPVSATTSYLNESVCEYTWSQKIEESGKFTISFDGIKQCTVPPIEFNFETGKKYNYESLGA